ncbi:hypothetical protein MXD81_31320, partial [Microbacteriaceae bacterium K1510]|nr:hypothetical protein [Microbacteriaceae bacterium K1510]
SLLAVLLDPSVKKHDAANAIGFHFLRRLKQLLQIDWEKSLGAFETHFGRTKEASVAGGRLVHVHPDGLANDENLCAVGEARLEALLAELHQADEADEAQTMFRRLDERRLRKRELLCLGSLEADVEFNSFGQLLVRARDGDQIADMPTVAVGATEAIPQGTGRGSLEFYLIPANNARASVIVRGRELAYVNFEGPISEDRKLQLKELFGTRSKDLK